MTTDEGSGTLAIRGVVKFTWSIVSAPMLNEDEIPLRAVVVRMTSQTGRR
jgi:hypothetical protein